MRSIIVLQVLTLPASALSDTLNPRGNESPSLADDPSPKLSECLLSAVSDDDCGTVLEGCIWCAEPIYGLCLTESAAKKVKWMPFLTCTFPDEEVAEIAEINDSQVIQVNDMNDVKFRIA
ncbi:hypothetical protein ACHAWO_004965 [Cyclotella atomus]|jgi:hypothetical protein|uniref:Uncharacterized protein n=1 Tax=Cyclotella atomus TaxID=382360 RepID=A0ABD3MVY1_9STRA